MNRDYKEFAEGEFFHVYNRGNNRQNIFLDDKDYQAFLLRLGLCLGLNEKDLIQSKSPHLSRSRVRIIAKPNQFKIHAYCLMPNHFHLLIEQLSTINISNLILKLCTSYTRYFNAKYGRVGTIFQDCFKAVRVGATNQLMWTSSYIHMNPVKDSLSRKPDEYLWSSYKDYYRESMDPILTKDYLLSVFESLENLKNQTTSYMSKVPFGFLDVV
jgi:REP element-mobilizing transposase RayT